MRTILTIFILLTGLNFASAQVAPATSQNDITLFGQCMIEVSSAEEMKALETVMRENPYVRVVRLDYPTQRAFILTRDIDELSEEDFTSWFGEYSNTVRCIQIGRHGVDAINPYPFAGCEK